MENKLENYSFERVIYNEKLDDIIGLEGIKEFLKEKKKIVMRKESAKKFGIQLPKGILIAGIPGCGKSLVPKLCSLILEIPIFKINYKELIKNDLKTKEIFDYIDTLESCILCIDSVKSNDKENYIAMLAHVKKIKEEIFIVVVLDDVFTIDFKEYVNILYDEMFFLDIPEYEERIKSIIEMLKKIKVSNIDGAALELSNSTKNYTIKEIKFLMNKVMENMFIEENNFQVERFLKIKDTYNPISKIYKEEIEKIREKLETFNIKKSSQIKSKDYCLRKVLKKDDIIFVQGGLYKASFYIEEREVSNLYVMKNLVTQKMWYEVMEENPSHFKGENFPVERVSWWKSLEYCNKLSEIYGLTPVYILEDGALKINYIDGSKVLPNEADFKKTEGYRLPTELEWEWLATGGEFKKNEDEESELDDIAWYWDNSSIKSHEVGLKKPNELGIYDMFGNVWEWCYDTKSIGELKEETPYLYDTTESYRRLKGGSWGNYKNYCTPGYRYYGGAVGYGSNIGLRVVRTIR